MDNIDLPDDVKYIFELLDEVEMATVAELRGRRLQAVKVGALELSRQLQAQCLREDLDMEGVDIESVEMQKDEISNECNLQEHDQALIRDVLSLYPEYPPPLPDVDWDSLQKYSREVVDRMEETRTILLDVTKDDHILLERKREKEEHYKQQRAEIHPVLNNLESPRDRLENVCRIFRRPKVAPENPSQTPENTSLSAAHEELSSPLPSTHAPIPLADDALYRLSQKLIADAGSLHESHTADECRLSALESEFKSAMSDVELQHDADPLPISIPIPQPKPTMEEIRPLVKSLVEEQFKANASLLSRSLKYEVLLQADAVHDELSEKIADSNRLMCKILLLSPNYDKEEGEIASPRASPTISERPAFKEANRSSNHI